MKKIRLSILTILIVILALAIFTPAGAVPLIHTEFDFVDEFVDTGICGFPVQLRFEGEGTEHLFFEKDGETPKKVVVNYSDNGTATNLDTGTTISGHDAWTVIVEFEDGVPITETTAGLFFHFNAPGHGIVLIDAGKIAFDLATGEVVVNGPHQVWEGDFDAFCAALADG